MSITNIILVENINIDYLIKHPVWQYCNIDEIGETAVRPINKLPVKNLIGKFVGTKVKLSNNNYVWATLENIDVNNPTFTQHFITLSIENNGRWFTLSRYHDFDYESNGPKTLAEFLDLSIDMVFPIYYDITNVVVGNNESLSGYIFKEPKKKLSRAEIIAMAVP